jgi:phage shock protein E
MRLKEIVNTDTVFVDVRTKNEFAAGHLDGAINIPLGDIAQRNRK